jgi:murein DD-endopeptidase MepM/ murein hydrolase activator NlpD
MSRIAELLCSRRVPQVAVLTLISFGFAGCSADMSTRFQQDPLSNPFASQHEATGSVQQPAVERRELPQYARPQASYESQPLPPPAVTAPKSYPVSSVGVSGGGRGISSYAPPPRPQLETTGTVPPRSIAANRAPAQPAAVAQPATAVPAAAQRSTTIIVGTSDTLDVLAQRYHVTPAAILAANGYKGPRTLSPGQQLIIPHATAVAALPPAAPAARPVAVASPASSFHVVNPGDTLASIARHSHLSVGELARANNLDASAKLKLGTRLTVPAARTAAVMPAPAASAPAVAAIQPVAAPLPTTRVAAAAPQQTARLAQATTTPEQTEAAEAPIKASEATGALPTFRWPVRGKVITSYGAKTNGKANDGINVAVPEGTPVKAAEDGVVAYAGNELKGYGNLVLVRHSNGYVTAYAHASEVLVKRGDSIKRGQVIAKSGQSGEVASPQLHFEIRKGSNPVDPLQFLNGA